jgi:probable F420-dependent oxidoreductase
VAGRIAISVTVSGLARLLGGDLARVVDLARAADAAGIAQLALPDHLAIGPRTDRYPYGRFPYGSDEPWLEPLTTLAALAAATRRIRLATGVLLAALRPALVLAKTLATLDVLSRGRLDLGVGIGWQAEEFAGAGVPFAGRAARLDDTLRACRALWSGAPASFDSPTARFAELWSLPRPVQAGGIPVWFGVALGPGNLRRIAELGSGWMPIGAGPAEVADGVRRLREALRAAGRDPAELRVRAPAPIVRGVDGGIDLEATLGRLDELRRAGATHAGFALDRFVRDASEIEPFLARLGAYARE